MSNINFRVDDGRCAATVQLGGDPTVELITPKDECSIPPFISLGWVHNDHPKTYRSVHTYLDKYDAIALVDKLNLVISRMRQEEDTE